MLGRTYVHQRVHAAIIASYQQLEKTMPNVKYVYGETGLRRGGRFKPHRTHQNGLSVDFMVPVRDANAQSVPLPASMTNRYGYDLEFDGQGKLDNLRIDFEAIAEHLYQLQQAAKANGIGISRVIFDPPYLPKLFSTKRGAWLEKNLSFMRNSAWVRYDEHYHVDFSIPCLRLAAS